MIAKYRLIFLVLCVALMARGHAEETKTGWSVGGVPVVSYDSDKGFEYGIVVALHNFGDGEDYPAYQQKFQAEWSRYTGGSGINDLFFDAPDLLFGKIRLTSYVGYLTELLQPFYGFNGYASRYEPAYVISEPEEPGYNQDLYKSRAYYAHDRKMWKITTDFQGDITSPRFRWIAGLGALAVRVGRPDVDRLNSRLNPETPIPDSSLYASMVEDGRIPADEARGGQCNFLKVGLIYDTRDNEANPMSGLWTEVFLTTYTPLLGSDFTYTLATLQHRQYFTLIPRRLSFTYRLGFQSTIAGDIPFFDLPFLMSSYKIREGLGGKWTIRGMLKNRAVGRSMGFLNTECRWKFYRTQLFHQNFYAALGFFFDTGRVFSSPEDHLHSAYGSGIYLAMNENFIVGLDYGRAIDRQDGTSGMYVHMDYLY